MQRKRGSEERYCFISSLSKIAGFKEPKEAMSLPFEIQNPRKQICKKILLPCIIRWCVVQCSLKFHYKAST